MIQSQSKLRHQLPLYIDGEVPQPLTRAGSEFSDDSIWWLFKKLDDCVSEDFAEKTPRVQEAFGKIEADFLARTGNVEAEAAALRSSESVEYSRSCLTRFMNENLDTAIATLRDLLAEFGEAPIGRWRRVEALLMKAEALSPLGDWEEELLTIARIALSGVQN